MLRLGKLTDYALLVIGRMAKDPHVVLSANVLASSLNLSPPTVSKILKILSDASLVSSVRGADGGYLLLKPAKDITIADIIIAMEGEIAVTACCESTGLCAIDASCQMRDNWRKINEVIQSFLGKLTIIDMLAPLSLTDVTQGFTHGK